jgi:hypothetical protein
MSERSAADDFENFEHGCGGGIAKVSVLAFASEEELRLEGKGSPQHVGIRCCGP